MGLQENFDSLKKENSDLVKKLRITKLNFDLQSIDMKESTKKLEKAELAIKQMSGHQLTHLELPELRKLRRRVWQSLARIEGEIQEKEDNELTCSVCTERRNSHCLVPCGHRFCPECIPKFNRRCPICRKQFRQSVEIF